MNSQKTKNIVKIAVLAVIVLILLGILTAGVVGKQLKDLAVSGISAISDRLNDDDSGAALPGVTETTAPTEPEPAYSSATNGTGAFNLRAEQVRSIDITWVSGKVNVENTASDAIEVSEANAETQLQWVLDEYGNLNIRCCDSEHHIRAHDKDLTVRLPQDKQLEDFEIQSASSDIEIQTLLADEFKAEGASGSLRAAALGANSASVKTVSGDIHIAGSIAEEVDLESVSGSMEIETAVLPQDLDAKSVSGNWRLTLPKGSDFFAEIKTVSGAVSADDFGLSSAQPSRGTYTFGSEENDTEFHFETVSGSVRIVPAD